MSPNSENLLYQYGRLLIDTPSNAAALTVFKRLAEIDPSNHTYFGYLGNCYVTLGLTGLAMEAYEKANELADGKQAWILGNIGNLFKNQGLYSLAIRNLKGALTIDPDSAYSHERLAAALKNDSEERTKASEIVRNYKEQQAAKAIATLAEPATTSSASSAEIQSDPTSD